MKTLELSLLGRPQICLDGQHVVGLRSRKARAILFYLAVTNQTQTRQKLAGFLWPEKTTDKGLNSLRGAIKKLYDYLDPYLDKPRRHTIAMRQGSPCWVDVVFFRECLKGQQPTLSQLQTAVGLYHADFLQDFYIPGADEFNIWVEEERADLERLARTAISHLANHHAQQKNYSDAIEHGWKLLILDPWSEEIHRDLMEWLARNGERNKALAHYENYCGELMAELGVEPEEATQSLYEQITWDEIGPDTSSEAADSQFVLPKIPPFQPPQLTKSFVDRQSEKNWLCQRLTQKGNQKNIAIVGMGGLGKTALANSITHILREQFKDGVLWANASASGPLAILESWATAFGYDFSRLPDVESRATAFRGVLTDKKVLIVLDNVNNAARVRPLLPGNSQSAVLLTTRDLDIARALEADVFMLNELGIEYSYQLFGRILGEARLAAEPEAVAEICSLLQNLPLAIEVLAQRLKSRPRRLLSDMAARLRDVKHRLAVLKISDREVRASFEISWETLDVQLQDVFSSLGVFGGRPFTVKSLAYISQLDEYMAEEKLFSLEALSLVGVREGQFYQQHALLADYAREKLGEDEAVFGRYTDYYLYFVQQNQNNYNALRPEWENIMMAMEKTFEQKLWSSLIRFSQALSTAWFTRARYTQARRGYQWVSEAALALADEITLAETLLYWGQACIEQNDYDEAIELLSKCLLLSDKIGNDENIATSQYHLARVFLEQSKYDEAEELLASSQNIRQELGDVKGVASVLFRRARIFFRHGEHDQAEKVGLEALRLQNAINDQHGCLPTLRLLSSIAVRKEAYDLAKSYCEQAYTLCHELQDNGELAAVLYRFSVVCRRCKELDSAHKYATEALKLFRQIGDRKLQGLTLYVLSLIYEDQRAFPEALQVGLQSRALLREVNDEYNLVFILIHLGDLHVHLAQDEQAQKSWKDAMLIGQRQNHSELSSIKQRLYP